VLALSLIWVTSLAVETVTLVSAASFTWVTKFVPKIILMPSFSGASPKSIVAAC
jgi:hypothetical protein